MNRSLLAIQDRLNVLCSGYQGGFGDTGFEGDTGVKKELDRVLEVVRQNVLRSFRATPDNQQESEPLVLCGYTLKTILYNSWQEYYTLFYGNHTGSIDIMMCIYCIQRPFTASGVLLPDNDQHKVIEKTV